MEEREIDGKRKFCFIVSVGEANDIVIPIDRLIPIDYKRLKKMSSEGGNMLRIMRDTILENGKNALALYEHLLVVVPKTNRAISKNVAEERRESTEHNVKSSKKEKRGRGRPKKSEIS